VAESPSGLSVVGRDVRGLCTTCHCRIPRRQGPAGMGRRRMFTGRSRKGNADAAYWMDNGPGGTMAASQLTQSTTISVATPAGVSGSE
jgi:hypothetical protein